MASPTHNQPHTSTTAVIRNLRAEHLLLTNSYRAGTNRTMSDVTVGMRTTTVTTTAIALVATMTLAAGCGGDSNSDHQSSSQSSSHGNVIKGGHHDNDQDGGRGDAYQEDGGGSGDPAAGLANPEAGAAEDDRALAVAPDNPYGEPEPEPEPDVFNGYGYRNFVDTQVDPLSTFALDVDTGSYSYTRAALNQQVLPDPGVVRPEEFINAFRYDYPAPKRGLGITIDGAPSPFTLDNAIIRIGVSAADMTPTERPPVALTFVIDTSGSMAGPERLGLVKRSLAYLVESLNPNDTVAIVTYESDSGIVLNPTPIRHANRILTAIDRLEAGGSTNLEAGLEEGYRLAAESFRRDGINRVIIASDGMANVGITDSDALATMIRDEADDGIQLVTLGYGLGGYNDVTMEQVADQGDGFYAYIDTMDEARKLFGEQLTSTLVTVALDAKIQVEFDPEIVLAYRLIGYENRAIADSDFRNDQVDAGEIGAGHQVTALYEVTFIDEQTRLIHDSLGQVSLRWQNPDTRKVTEITKAIDPPPVTTAWRDIEEEITLAVTVGAFAEVLRHNPYAANLALTDIARTADELATLYHSPEIDEFADLVSIAEELYYTDSRIDNAWDD